MPRPRGWSWRKGAEKTACAWFDTRIRYCIQLSSYLQTTAPQSPLQILCAPAAATTTTTNTTTTTTTNNFQILLLTYVSRCSCYSLRMYAFIWKSIHVFWYKFIYVYVDLDQLQEEYTVCLSILSPKLYVCMYVCMYVCVLQIYDSPTLPESECGFSLGPAGIEDAKE